MIKLVALDLDGTINDGWDIVPELGVKIEELQADGIKVAITSGRDVFGCLFFAVNTNIHFDFICGGGGGILKDFNPYKLVKDMFLSSITRESIKNCHLTKIGRIVKLTEILGIKEEEVLFIDDGPTRKDFEEVKERNFVLGCPQPNLQFMEWTNLVRSRGGIVGYYPCGRGTLEILNRLFK